jgi:7-carboxy-7-deazaguanine synthase (Cx14CxxC type)
MVEKTRAYQVKEVYVTLQGEGYHVGRAAVFLRFSGCNLWSGRERDREKAICQFCDTNFWGTDGPGGGTFEGPESLAVSVARCWLERAGNQHDTAATQGLSLATGLSCSEFCTTRPLVVCTGGEPLLQLDAPLIAALHEQGFEVAIETNGTRPLPPAEHDAQRVDWVCVSPKANAPLVLTAGDELKLVYPQPTLGPESVEHLSFTHFYLQPMDGPAQQHHTRLAIEYIQRHPRWRLSLQTHKLLGIP